MIRDYPELIATVTTRSQIPDVATHAASYVGLAEKALNKRLRVAGMETAATLTTDAKGVVALPDGYLEMRDIRCGDYLLRRLPLQTLKAGMPGYAIQGADLLASAKEADLNVVFYATLPPLAENNTNWLLAQDPEIYLYATLFQVFTAEFQIDKAQATAAHLDQLIDDLEAADHTARFAGTMVDFSGVSA